MSTEALAEEKTNVSDVAKRRLKTKVRREEKTKDKSRDAMLCVLEDYDRPVKLMKYMS